MRTNNATSVPFGVSFEEPLPSHRTCEYKSDRQDHGLTFDDMKRRGVEMATMGTGTGTHRDRDG